MKAVDGRSVNHMVESWWCNGKEASVLRHATWLATGEMNMFGLALHHTMEHQFISRACCFGVAVLGIFADLTTGAWQIFTSQPWKFVFLSFSESRRPISGRSKHTRRPAALPPLPMPMLGTGLDWADLERG